MKQSKRLEPKPEKKKELKLNIKNINYYYNKKSKINSYHFKKTFIILLI